MPKPKVERAVFEAFLRARGLQCSSDEIDQPTPPAPDILWRPAEGTPVAFELTEVVEENVAKHLAVDQSASRACWDEFQRLSDRDKSILDGRLFSIRIHPSLGARHVIEVCRGVLRDLPARTVEFDADGRVDLRIPIGAGYSPVEVGISAPCGFTSFRLSWMGAWQERSPTLRAAESKLARKYNCSGAPELLAYFWNQHSGYFDRFERSALESRFECDDARSPFRRIWVFDARRGVILALFPRRDAAALGVDIVSADPGHGLFDDVDPTREIQKRP